MLFLLNCGQFKGRQCRFKKKGPGIAPGPFICLFPKETVLKSGMIYFLPANLRLTPPIALMVA